MHPYNDILWFNGYRKKGRWITSHTQRKAGIYAGVLLPKATMAIPAAAINTSPTIIYVVLPPEVNIAIIPMTNNTPPAMPPICIFSHFHFCAIYKHIIVTYKYKCLS